MPRLKLKPKFVKRIKAISIPLGPDGKPLPHPLGRRGVLLKVNCWWLVQWAESESAQKATKYEEWVTVYDGPLYDEARIIYASIKVK